MDFLLGWSAAGRRRQKVDDQQTAARTPRARNVGGMVAAAAARCSLLGATPRRVLTCTAVIGIGTH
jgi:hypothetical protein